MQRCNFPESEPRFDELVRTHAARLEADPICSTSSWIVPNAAAFAPDAIHQVFEDDAGMVAMLEHPNPRGPVLTSFDQPRTAGVRVGINF